MWKSQEFRKFENYISFGESLYFHIPWGEQTQRSSNCIYSKVWSPIVIRIAEHACDDASKRIFSAHWLQKFLVRDQCLWSLHTNQATDQATAGKLKKHVVKLMLAILTTYMETRLYLTSALWHFRKSLTDIGSIISAWNFLRTGCDKIT